MVAVTPQKLDANRANAQLSTGPRTEAGKCASSQNALTFGAHAASPVAPGEDPAEFESFRREQVAGLNPATAPERALADRAASLMWRLQRLQAAQHALDLSPESLTTAYAGDHNDHPFDRLIKAEQRLTGMLNTTLRNLHQLQSRRRNEAAAEEELQNEPKPTAPSASSASSAPPRCNSSPVELQNEPKPISSSSSPVPSASSVFSLLPQELQNEPKPTPAPAHNSGQSASDAQTQTPATSP